VFTADFLSVAANVLLLFLALRLIQTHVASDSTLGSALAFIFH
jgi:hypothetical protein